ncbi:hypothetical protein [Nannocystis pusilla]|uniref:hypothetical protein n=1 Tax=Nannocystis pusilla TaxID=889268 RepID=UPI003B7E535D
MRPLFTSLTGEEVLRPGDILHLPPAAMIVGPPGHYRYFTDPARPHALELEFDGGPRHLVALRVASRRLHLEHIDAPDVPGAGESETIDRPLAELRQLRGLALETWSDDIATTVARLDGAQLIVSFDGAHSLGFGPSPELPSALPPDLRALRLDVAVGEFLLSPPPDPVAPAPFALDALPALSELRSLELRVTRLGAVERFDAAALARFPALQRLVLDSSLRCATRSSCERSPGYASSISTVTATSGTSSSCERSPSCAGSTSPSPASGRWGRSPVTRSSPSCSPTPLRSPRCRTSPPGLRELSVMSTRLADDAVDSFAAAAPQAVVRHRWNQRLADAAACATRIHVRTGGICHRRPERERTLFASDDPAEVRELLPLLHVDEARSDSYCMCCGTLTIELHRDDTPMAEVTLHHGRTLRHDGWPADGQLTDPRPLCSWLARHGVADACGDEP